MAVEPPPRVSLVRSLASEASPSAEAYATMRENYDCLRTKYDELQKRYRELLWHQSVLRGAGLVELMPAVDPTLEESAERVSEIELVKVIGRGTFSTVFLGRWPSGQRCAVKRISKGAARDVLDLRNIATEHEALRTLSRGPCVLGLHCAFASQSYIYFVCEYFGEELYKYLRNTNRQSLPPGFDAAVIQGVANGLAFMHSLCYAHRDVKPENVLVDVTGSDIVVKVCDLGLCAKLDVVGASTGTDRRYKPLFKCCGSMGFFAPDMLDAAGYNGAAADAWSLGCLGLEVVAGPDQFETVWFDKYRHFFRLRGKGAEYNEFVDWLAPTCAELESLVEACCVSDTRQRATPKRQGDDEDDFDAAVRRASVEPTSAFTVMVRRNWQVFSIVTKCLRLRPNDRPAAFEVRDMLAACAHCESTTPTPLADTVVAQGRLSSDSIDNTKNDNHDDDKVHDDDPSSLCAYPCGLLRRLSHAVRSLFLCLSRTVRSRISLWGRRDAEKAQTPTRSRLPQTPTRRVVPSDALNARHLESSTSSSSRDEGSVSRALRDFSPQARRGKVLVVDDSNVALHWICKAIESHYICEVHTASSAMEALVYVEHNDYDAILTDMIMPHMDGFQLVSALRKREETNRDATNNRRVFICALTQLAEAFDVLENVDVDVVSRKPTSGALELGFLDPLLTKRDNSTYRDRSHH